MRAVRPRDVDMSRSEWYAYRAGHLTWALIRHLVLALYYLAAPRNFARRKRWKMSDIKSRKAANLSETEVIALIELFKLPAVTAVLALAPSNHVRELQTLLDIHHSAVDLGFPHIGAMPRAQVITTIGVIHAADVRQIKRGK